MCDLCVTMHANKLPFEGVLTLLDVPSDAAPSGSRGHRVILSTAAAEAARASLLGMAVAFKDGWAGHNPRQKCGVITGAAIVPGRLIVNGYLFERDFPEVSEAMRKYGGKMGMSFEMCDCHIADMREPVWTITRTTFTGAAILLREKAAYRDSSIQLGCHTLALHAGAEQQPCWRAKSRSLWREGQSVVKRLRF